MSAFGLPPPPSRCGRPLCMAPKGADKNGASGDGRWAADDMLACMDNTINSATAVVKALGGTQEKNIFKMRAPLCAFP